MGRERNALAANILTVSSNIFVQSIYRDKAAKIPILSLVQTNVLERVFAVLKDRDVCQLITEILNERENTNLAFQLREDALIASKDEFARAGNELFSNPGQDLSEDDDRPFVFRGEEYEKKKFYFRNLDRQILDGLGKIAFEDQKYEVCQMIKEIMEEREQITYT